MHIQKYFPYHLYFLFGNSKFVTWQHIDQVIQIAD
jgi:hypothetical protein